MQMLNIKRLKKVPEFITLNCDGLSKSVVLNYLKPVNWFKKLMFHVGIIKSPYMSVTVALIPSDVGINHNQDFDWGYVCPAAKQLAYDVLIEFFDLRETMLMLDAFTEVVIGQLKPDKVAIEYGNLTNSRTFSVEIEFRTLLLALNDYYTESRNIKTFFNFMQLDYERTLPTFSATTRASYTAPPTASAKVENMANSIDYNPKGKLVQDKDGNYEWRE